MDVHVEAIIPRSYSERHWTNASSQIFQTKDNKTRNTLTFGVWGSVGNQYPIENCQLCHNTANKNTPHLLLATQF